jgi:outer membrane protein OmpA-like peptidoglycan-associated protein
MNKIVVILTAVLLAGSSAFAEMGFDVGGGINISNLHATGDYSSSGFKSLSGFNLDLDYSYSFSNRMGVIAGIDLESRGTAYSGTDTTINLRYLEIPVLFSYNFLPKVVPGILSDLTGSIGPQLGFLIGTVNPPTQSVDFGGALNISGTFFNTLILGVGYSRGFSNIDKYPYGASGSVSNSNFKMFVEYKCPISSGGKNKVVSVARAPAPVPPPVPVPPPSVIAQFTGAIKGINFDLGKATILPVSYPILNQAVSTLTMYKSLRIRIDGHTDSVGTHELNQKLSEDRAESVKAYLVSKGIDGSRIETAGFGDTRPVESNQTEEGRAANRRIEFSILNQ